MKIIPFPKRSTRPAPCPTRQRLSQAAEIIRQGLREATPSEPHALTQITDRLEGLIERLEALFQRQNG